MTIVYLGLFQRVFEWVMANILDPVYRFVSNLLTTVFTWIFQEILAPILMPVLEAAMEFFIDLWLTVWSTHLYMWFSGILKLIDYLQTAFDVFIGLEDVSYAETNGTVITGSLVEVLMQQKTVSTVFWVITMGALAIALLLTIYATAKSAFDLDFENKRPVSRVLTSMMKTFIQFFTVPFLVYFLLKLAAVILRGVTSALSFSGSTSLGRIVFTIASLDAAKNEAYNLSTATGGITLGTSPEDIIRYPFYTMGGEGVSPKDYGKLSAVTEYFDLAEFDYLIGFIAAVFLLFTIGVCLIVFVQRIFELIMLYLVSPYFVCMIPLDDGEKFGKWREMFVGKCFTGFGSAIGMRLFLLICPLVMGNQIRFGTNTSPEMDYMMKLFFIIGGAWAVYKSGSMLTSLLSAQAGMAEGSTANMVGGMLYGYTMGMAINKGKSAIGSALSGRGRKPGPPEGGDGSGKEGPGGAGGPAGQDPRFKGRSGRMAHGVLKSRALNKAVGGTAGAMGKTVRAGAKVSRGAGKVSGGVGWAAGKLRGKAAPGQKQNILRRASGRVADRANLFSAKAAGAGKDLDRLGNAFGTIREASKGPEGIAAIGRPEPPAPVPEKAPDKVQIEIGRHRLLNKGSSVTTDGQGAVSSWRFATPESRRANGAYYRPAARPAAHPASSVKSASASVAGAEVKHSDISIKGVSADVSALRSRRHSISVNSDGSYGSGGSGSYGGGSSAGGTPVSRHSVSVNSSGSYGSGSAAGSTPVHRSTISAGGGSYSGSAGGSGGSRTGGVTVRRGSLGGGEKTPVTRRTIK